MTIADPVLTRITQAVTAFRDGDTTGRSSLAALWSEIGPGGDPFHRCTLAHYLADMYDDAAESLIWDVRALDAADALTDDRVRRHHAALSVAGFYPSLHLNLADDLRRLSAFPAADRHLTAAHTHLGTLGDDEYGRGIRRALEEVAAAVAERSTERRPHGTP